MKCRIFFGEVCAVIQHCTHHARITYLARTLGQRNKVRDRGREVAAYHVCRNLALNITHSAVQAASEHLFRAAVCAGFLACQNVGVLRDPAREARQRAGVAFPNLADLLFLVLNIDIRVFADGFKFRTAAFIAVFAANSVLQYTQVLNIIRVENSVARAADIVIHRLKCVKLGVDALALVVESGVLSARSAVFGSSRNLGRQLVHHGFHAHLTQNAVVPLAFLGRCKARDVFLSKFQRRIAVAHTGLADLRMHFACHFIQLLHGALCLLEMDFALVLLHIICKLLLHGFVLRREFCTVLHVHIHTVLVRQALHNAFQPFALGILPADSLRVMLEYRCEICLINSLCFGGIAHNLAQHALRRVDLQTEVTA